MKQPAKSIKQRIKDYMKRRPEDTIYHPSELSKSLGVHVGHARSVMKELANEGLLVKLKDKNKYFFMLKIEQGIDPSIVSRPPKKKGRYHG